MMKRQTGDTSRVKLRAALALLEGKDVTVVTNKGFYAQSLCHQTARLFDVLGLGSQIQKRREELTFMGHSIRFRSIHALSSCGYQSCNSLRIDDGSVESELLAFPELQGS